MSWATVTKIAKPILGVGGAFGMVVLLVALAFAFHNYEYDAEFALTAIVAMTGVTIGWLLGFLASPYSKLESERFSKYAATLSAFITGYLVSKVEPWISAIINAGTSGSELLLVRLLIFTASAIASAISMYVFRLYLLWDEDRGT
jgi:hypothetical protein